jgi:hypothetical protein
MTDRRNAWLRIEIGDSIQQITLVWRSRHFGGRQWFFLCPATNRLATVLWKPPGASRFCSRQAWGRQVAYASQFLDRDGRAHHGQSKIKSRLCSIGKFDPDKWDLPPKPKWMRWRTYNRYEERFGTVRCWLGKVGRQAEAFGIEIGWLIPDYWEPMKACVGSNPSRPVFIDETSRP